MSWLWRVNGFCSVKNVSARTESRWSTACIPVPHLFASWQYLVLLGLWLCQVPAKPFSGLYPFVLLHHLKLPWNSDPCSSAPWAILLCSDEYCRWQLFLTHCRGRQNPWHLQSSVVVLLYARPSPPQHFWFKASLNTDMRLQTGYIVSKLQLFRYVFLGFQSLFAQHEAVLGRLIPW